MDELNGILSDLYHGKINVNEKFPDSKEYNNLIEESKEILNRINNIINDSEKELLNQYLEKQAQIISIECEQKFINGYKLASKLIITGIK